MKKRRRLSIGAPDPCCVRLICHVGKEAARSGALDQYASRGGSALADGARMVAVLRSWDPEATDDKLTPPPGLSFGTGEQVIVLARPKLSYAPPPPLIWITRRGYAFQHLTSTRPDPEAEARARADQVERYLISQLAGRARHSQKTLEDSGLMPRARLRTAISTLIASGRVVYAPLPEGLRHGGRKDYLHPVKATAPAGANERGEVGQKSTPTSPGPETPSTSPLPLRENRGGEVEAAAFSLPSCRLAGEGWRGSGAVGEVADDIADVLADGPGPTPFDEAVRRKAEAEPGYSKDAAARYCCVCAHRAADKRCLAWGELGAPEGWKPNDKAPRRCRGFMPMKSPIQGPVKP